MSTREYYVTPDGTTRVPWATITALQNNTLFPPPGSPASLRICLRHGIAVDDYRAFSDKPNYLFDACSRLHHLYRDEEIASIRREEGRKANTMRVHLQERDYAIAMKDDEISRLKAESAQLQARKYEEIATLKASAFEINAAKDDEIARLTAQIAHLNASRNLAASDDNRSSWVRHPVGHTMGLVSSSPIPSRSANPFSSPHPFSSPNPFSTPTGYMDVPSSPPQAPRMEPPPAYTSRNDQALTCAEAMAYFDVTAMDSVDEMMGKVERICKEYPDLADEAEEEFAMILAAREMGGRARGAKARAMLGI